MPTITLRGQHQRPLAPRKRLTRFLVGAGVLAAFGVVGPTPGSAQAAWIAPAHPNATNTGVPSGVSLRTVGAQTVTTDGAVLSGLDIRGCVAVKASNVTIKNSRITCANSTETAVRLQDGKHNLLVQDSEIDGAKLARTALYGADGVTINRVEVRNIQDGPRVGNNFRMTNSWVHAMYRPGTAHVDGLQTLGAQNVYVAGNSFEVYNATTGQQMNSVFMLGTETGPALKNIMFEKNYVNGGVCSINMRTDSRVSGNIVFRSNVFGPQSVRCTHTGMHGDVTWSSTNVWASNGTTANRVGG
jgi:hypothetical protein